MKIALDKNTITLAKVEEAKEFAKNESEWIDKDVLKGCASRILSKYYGTEYETVDEIVAMPKLEVVSNDYLEFYIYANDMIVKYWHKGEGDLTGYKMACLSFDVTGNATGTVGAYVQIFGNTDSRVICKF
jgi:hypothetical protein